jgi:DNA-binding NarL/FixJ family response regulator
MLNDLSETGVLIVDRHALFRHGLMGLLRQEKPDWRWAEASSIAEVQQQIHSASLVILDFGLPDLGGMEGLSRLRDRFPSHTFIVVSDSDDRETVLGCLTAGAQGCILRSATPAQVLRALDTILDGGIYAPATSPHRAAMQAPAPATATMVANLTDRQREVLGLLAEGCATKTIARRLDLGVGTVKVHLAAIYRTLGARSRLEVMAKMHRAYA